MILYRNSSHAQPSVVLGKLGMLLPIIADTLSRQKHGTLSDSALREATILFRNVWFLCVLYGFVDHGSWPLEWYMAVEAIASRTPVLISPVKNYIESDLELNSVLRQINAERVSLSPVHDIIGASNAY
jgi:phosphatidylinositol 4-kinase A